MIARRPTAAASAGLGIEPEEKQFSLRRTPKTESRQIASMFSARSGSVSAVDQGYFFNDRT
jgi:hypothetical protein